MYKRAEETRTVATVTVHVSFKDKATGVIVNKEIAFLHARTRRALGLCIAAPAIAAYDHFGRAEAQWRVLQREACVCRCRAARQVWQSVAVWSDVVSAQFDVRGVLQGILRFVPPMHGVGAAGAP